MNKNKIRAYRDKNCPIRTKELLIEEVIKKSEGFIVKTASFFKKEVEEITNELRIYIWECYEGIGGKCNLDKLNNIPEDKNISGLIMKNFYHFYIRNHYSDRRINSKKNIFKKNNVFYTDDLSSLSHHISYDYLKKEELKEFYKKLSQRQKDIVKGLLKKQKYSNIASFIGVTPMTVKNELKNIKKVFYKFAI